MVRQTSNGRMLERIDPKREGKEGEITVVIETPQGSRNKYKYDQEIDAFTLSSVLPAGASFPYDFGFVPSTVGDDGDPLDVLVLMDEPAFPGCVLAVRPIGVIEADQTEKDGKIEKNDRVICVASTARTHGNVRDIGDLADELVEEITHFFISYNDARGRRFEPTGKSNRGRALELIERGRGRFSEERDGADRKKD